MGKDYEREYERLETKINLATGLVYGLGIVALMIILNGV